MEVQRPSSEITATGAVFARAALIGTVLVITDGTNDAKVVLHDNAAAASGTVLGEFTCETAAEHSKPYRFDPPLRADNGVYATLTGTGASVIVYEVAPK